MKSIKLLLAIMFISSMSFAQTNPITFETGEPGASPWTWVAAGSPNFTIVPNPASGGINTSATVGRLFIPIAAQDWALVHTNSTHIGTWTINSSNYIVKIMVHKNRTSPVGIKFEGSSPAIELTVSNTLTNQWEELTFDFSAHIGKTYNRLVVIGDFAARPIDVTCLFDNITFSGDINNISGTLTYDNTANTPLASQTVKLMQGASEIASTTTDASGNYTFTSVASGNYTIVPVVTLDWKGVSATDASLILAHIDNSVPLTDLRLAAANVNGDGAVNATDVTDVFERIITETASFSAGNWVYSDLGVITVPGANTSQNIRAICFGDVNASYVFE